MAFREVFDEKKPEAKIVLSELNKICPSNVMRGVGNPIDDRQVYINIGRRQVLTHIMSIINMSDEKLKKIAEEEERING